MLGTYKDLLYNKVKKNLGRQSRKRRWHNAEGRHVRENTASSSASIERTAKAALRLVSLTN